VILYADLPRKLAAELDNPRRRTPVHWIAFNTASDSFQTDPEILSISYRSMEVILERGVGVSFLTKGWIPDRFVDLFSRFPDLVSARLGLVSIDPSYQEAFEPGAATPARRLETLERLRSAGLKVEVRVDPMIPFFTDDEASLARLCEALSEQEVRTVALSYLHLRPAILFQLRQELSAVQYGVLRSCFEAQSWTTVGGATRSKLIPLALRKRGYERFRRISRAFGITALVCACKNPDLPGQQCTAGPGVEGGRNPVGRGHEQQQLTLFAC
jgi:DNA repair photolyase